MKPLFTIFATGILLLYPFAIYFGLNYFSPAKLAVFLLVVILVRIALMKSSLQKMPWLLPATILGAIAILYSFITDSPMGFKLYPLAVNFSMLLVFSYSYFKPPTVIETFARLSEKGFSDQAISYTAKATLVWCLFFIVNALISLYTALYTSLDTWMIYNGFLSYIFMATLMGGEYLVRIQVKKRLQITDKKQQNISSGSSSHEQH